VDAAVMWLIALVVVAGLAIGFWGAFLVVIKLIGRLVSRRP